LFNSTTANDAALGSGMLHLDPTITIASLRNTTVRSLCVQKESRYSIIALRYIRRDAYIYLVYIVYHRILVSSKVIGLGFGLELPKPFSSGMLAKMLASYWTFCKMWCNICGLDVYSGCFL
jgi:hypothetical protein